MMSTFSKNLKRFRLSKNMTQEQVADALGVSTQSVSRWECNTTLPDVTMLPEIAKLYCITIDDLYKETSVAYENYAHRLGSIYESTRKPEDFLRADEEYQKLLKSGNVSMEDLRLYGILNQYMMQECLDKALSLFNLVLKHDPSEDEEAYWRTKRQKILLNCKMNKADTIISEQHKLLTANTSNVEEWICLIAAYHYSNQDHIAENWIKKALDKFPDNVALLIYCGDIYRGMHKYEEAFGYWEKALQLNPSYLDAQYSKGFCYEELGEYQKAYEVWCQLCDALARRGFDIEMIYPRILAEKCKEKLSL